MDTIIIRYEDNSSVRYDRKEYVESLSKVRREMSETGSLKIGKSVMVKTKSRVWKTMVVDPEPSAAATSQQLHFTSYRLTVHRSQFANDN